MRSSLPTVQARAAARQQIAEQVQDYLQRGGHIEILHASQRQTQVIRSSELWRDDSADPLLAELTHREH